MHMPTFELCCMGHISNVPKRKNIELLPDDD